MRDRRVTRLAATGWQGFGCERSSKLGFGVEPHSRINNTIRKFFQFYIDSQELLSLLFTGLKTDPILSQSCRMSSQTQ